jgi:hypothetical protein
MQASAVRRNKRAETGGARLGICLQSLRSPGAPWRRLRNPCNQLHALLTIGYFGTHIGQQSASFCQSDLLLVRPLTSLLQTIKIRGRT